MLKTLVDQQIKDSVAAKERHDESQQTIKDLLTELAAQRAAHVVPVLSGDAGGRAAAAPVVTRAEKISRMQLNLRKSNKLRVQRIYGDWSSEGMALKV